MWVVCVGAVHEWYQKRKGDEYHLDQAIRLVQAFATTSTYDEVSSLFQRRSLLVCGPMSNSRGKCVLI